MSGFAWISGKTPALGFISSHRILHIIHYNLYGAYFLIGSLLARHGAPNPSEIMGRDLGGRLGEGVKVLEKKSNKYKADKNEHTRALDDMPLPPNFLLALFVLWFGLAHHIPTAPGIL
jgi:hypothetical protein